MKYILIIKKMNRIKAILVGASKVGKTSIITQFINRKFDQEYIATYSPNDKSIKEIDLKNGKKITLEIWDTVGQESLRATNKIFMKNAKMALLVYDITKKETFDNLNSFYNEIDNVIGKNKVLLGVVGNKSDLYEEQVVTKEKGEEYAKSINALFFETSAKDNESINKLFFKMSFQYNLIYGGNNEIINSFKIKKENDSKIENNEQNNNNNNNNNPIRIKKKKFFC